MKRFLLLLGILSLLGSSYACSRGETEVSDSVLSDAEDSFTTSDTGPIETTAPMSSDQTEEGSEMTPSETESESEWVTETETESETQSDAVTTEPPYYTIDGYTYRVDVRAYLSYICPKNADAYLILANRNHPIGSDYVPNDLVSMNTNPGKKLRKAASYACDAMFAEMKVLGVCDSFPQSTYRSYSLQVKLYEEYLENERKRHPTYTEEQLVALVDSYSARPGTSDHQTGLAIDFSPISTSFQRTKMFRYLSENAHKFGFILRFPKGKTAITGYMYESWHWRFVGREAATYIYENGITLEEYLEERYGGIIPPDTSLPEVSDPVGSESEETFPEEDGTVTDNLPPDTTNDWDSTEPMEPDISTENAAPPETSGDMRDTSDSEVTPPSFSQDESIERPLETSWEESVLPPDNTSQEISQPEESEEERQTVVSDFEPPLSESEPESVSESQQDSLT